MLRPVPVLCQQPAWQAHVGTRIYRRLAADTNQRNTVGRVYIVLSSIVVEANMQSAWHHRLIQTAGRKFEPPVDGLPAKGKRGACMQIDV
jgi:hypothetical protein